MTVDPPLHRIVAAQPYPLLFAGISGERLSGFRCPMHRIGLNEA
jgi:hypothetical protein